LADWAKGFGAKGLAVTKVSAGGFDTGIAKFIQPIAPRLIERTAATEGDLLCFAADRPRIVHKVLGELRLKMARDLQLKPSTDFAWVWVVNFPLFEWDEEERRWNAAHHPFTSVHDEDLDKLVSDPARCRAKSYDLVLNGIELGSGSIRIHRRDVQAKVFNALGFTDDGRPVVSAGMLRKALHYQRLAGGVIALHEEDPALSRDGVMHEGPTSARLGLAGIPSVSESTMIARDAALALYEEARVHFQHLSALESVEALAQAKEAGARVLGAGSIIDRSGGRADLGVPRVALKTLEVTAYQPDDCPLCREGVALVKPGSRPVTAKQ